MNTIKVIRTSGELNSFKAEVICFQTTNRAHSLFGVLLYFLSKRMKRSPQEFSTLERLLCGGMKLYRLNVLLHNSKPEGGLARGVRKQAFVIESGWVAQW